jgi:hypothetical protein
MYCAKLIHITQKEWILHFNTILIKYKYQNVRKNNTQARVDTLGEKKICL